jgi:hypothetical protein
MCFVGWAPLPEQAPYLFWGYGWLDSTVTDAVVACALGRSCPPKSAEAQQYNEQRRALRVATDQPLVQPPVAEQDAGTKRDAGADRRGAVAVVPGKGYTARLDTYGLGGDTGDAYAFDARAGQRITVTAAATMSGADASAVGGCWELLDPADRHVDRTETGARVYAPYCASTSTGAPPQGIVAPATGSYLLVYSPRDATPPHDYRFTIALR